VLEKAIGVFWKRGFSDTSVQDLERATGVNKSGLYSEFRDKEDFFVQCLRYYLAAQQKRGLLTEEPLGWKNVKSGKNSRARKIESLMKVLPASSRFAFLLSAKVIRCPVPTRKSVLIEALNLQRGVVGCNGMFLPLASLLFSLRRCLQTRPALR
jgi:AcrR family transcriptional regulator